MRVFERLGVQKPSVFLKNSGIENALIEISTACEEAGLSRLAVALTNLLMDMPRKDRTMKLVRKEL